MRNRVSAAIQWATIRQAAMQWAAMQWAAIRRVAICWAAIGSIAICGTGFSGGEMATAAERPRLVVLITVDQLRGDMPDRVRDRFGEGGFRYLMEQGVVFTQAHYRHATTFTAVGHATLATGGHAAQHGMAGNDWFNVQAGQQVYCVEDERHHQLGKAPKAHAGTSPRNLTSSTFGDELIKATGGRARVFSVSIKDRGAIIPGGHLGKAFWYDSSGGHFVTSTYYYDAYPQWVADWNAGKPANKYRNASWTLLRDQSKYLAGERDDRPFEQSYKDLGRTFPHPLDTGDESDLYATLRCTPMGDELTLDFAQALLQAEQLGRKGETDVLAISFSATDYIGHSFGPNSLEAEDNLLRLDRTLARLFKLVDEQVGLDRALIVLSSDHGVDASPEYSLSLGFSAGRHNPLAMVETCNERLRERLEIKEDVIRAFKNPSLYLDPEVLKKHDLDVRRVERMLIEEVLAIPGFAYAVARTDLLAGKVGGDPILEKVQRAFHPRRSGNVLVVQEPSWFLASAPSTMTAMHGSPYAYDTYVPVMFAGAGIEPRVVDRPMGPSDVAPTICRLLNIKAPTGSTGTSLVEVERRETPRKPGPVREQD